MPSEVIALRTNYYDSTLDGFVRKLIKTSGRPLVIVADEAAGRFQTPLDIRKIVVDPVFLGLYCHPRFGWRCGDYSLYAAHVAMPDVEFFWLIEPDVRIHCLHTEALFTGTGQSTDFITPWFVKSSDQWSWYTSIAPFFPEVYNCMLQFCRFSRTAASILHKSRVDLSHDFISNNADPDAWPNDEAFIGAAVIANGLSVQTLADHAPGFTIDRTFTFTQPTSEHWLRTRPLNNALYHPVVEGPKFHQRMRDFLNSMSHLSTTDRDAAAAMLKQQVDYEPESQW